MTAAPESGEACGAIPPNVGGPVPCHLPRRHGGQHFSTSGCEGSEIRWTAAPEGETDASVRLTDAEDVLLTEWWVGEGGDHEDLALDSLSTVVERIVAERLRVVVAERDAAMASGADLARALAATIVRAESAEAAHAALREWVTCEDETCPKMPMFHGHNVRRPPEPSEVAETTAGEWRLCGPCRRGQTHVCDGNEYLRCDNAAEPDAGEVDEGLRALLNRLLTDEYGEERWDELRSLERIERAVLASPWLAARVSAAETKARADERERIAQAIEHGKQTWAASARLHRWPSGTHSTSPEETPAAR